MQQKASKINHNLAPLSAIAVLLVSAMVPFMAQAGQLGNRSLELGSAAAGAETTHDFEFDIGTSSSVGAFEFEYCENDPFPGESCDAPTGMDADSATLEDQTGASGFSINTTSANTIVVTNSTPQSFDAEDEVTFDFDNVTNPTAANEEYFVRIYSYDTESLGTVIDDGGLAFATAETVEVTARVQETLQFCVYTGNDCNDGGTEANLGILNTAATETAESYFDVATNARNGVSVQYIGSTLTSDGEVIDPVDDGNGGFEAASTGTEQFGLRLTSIAATDSGTVLGDESGSYLTNGDYALNEDTPTEIATSGGPIASTTYTVEYMANVDALTPTGVYDTQFEYIATASF